MYHPILDKGKRTIGSRLKKKVKLQRSSVELHGPANQGCARDDLQYLPASGRVTAQEGAKGKRLEGWSIVRTGGEKERGPT